MRRKTKIRERQKAAKNNSAWYSGHSTKVEIAVSSVNGPNDVVCEIFAYLFQYQDTTDLVKLSINGFIPFIQQLNKGKLVVGTSNML